MACTRAARAVVPLTLAAFLSAGAPASATPPDPDPWWGRDKALHFGLDAAISGAAYGFTSLATGDVRIRIAFGAGAGLLAGAGKELVDMAGAGTPSWRDFTWSMIGMAVGVAVAVSIDLAVRSVEPRVAAVGR